MKKKLYFLYRDICSRMDILLNSNDRYYKELNAKRVINQSFKLEGYVLCLSDLGILSNNVAKKFFRFTKRVRCDVNTLLHSDFELR